MATRVWEDDDPPTRHSFSTTGLEHVANTSIHPGALSFSPYPSSRDGGRPKAYREACECTTQDDRVGHWDLPAAGRTGEPIRPPFSTTTFQRKRKGSAAGPSSSSSSSWCFFCPSPIPAERQRSALFCSHAKTRRGAAGGGRFPFPLSPPLASPHKGGFPIATVFHKYRRRGPEQLVSDGEKACVVEEGSRHRRGSASTVRDAHQCTGFSFTPSRCARRGLVFGEGENEMGQEEARERREGKGGKRPPLQQWNASSTKAYPHTLAGYFTPGKGDPHRRGEGEGHQYHTNEAEEGRHKRRTTGTPLAWCIEARDVVVVVVFFLFLLDACILSFFAPKVGRGGGGVPPCIVAPLSRSKEGNGGNSPPPRTAGSSSCDCSFSFSSYATRPIHHHLVVPFPCFREYDPY